MNEMDEPEVIGIVPKEEEVSQEDLDFVKAFKPTYNHENGTDKLNEALGVSLDDWRRFQNIVRRKYNSAQKRAESYSTLFEALERDFTPFELAVLLTQESKASSFIRSLFK